MAQVVLSAVGQQVGGGIGRVIGATIGRAIDNRVIGSLGPARQIGPRIETLKVQGTAEGSPMACVFGRARVTGQVIWAARFLEGRTKGRAGKGGPKTVDYTYSLSFAVALCEGEIDGIGRVWADGRPMDMTGVAMRVHRGGEEQTPDPLIEAVEGASQAGSAGGSGGAPAYRGTAYVVFEDLPLGPFGDRVPQLSFEVFRRPRGAAPRLEDLLEGVCLIPGAGEFALATEAVLRREGLTRTTAENMHNGEGRADLLASLDQLQAQLPNLKRVSLVVGLVRQRPEGGGMPGAAGRGATRQADRAARLVGGGAGARRRLCRQSGRWGAGLWRDAVGRQRAPGDPRAEGAGTGSDAVSVRLHGLPRLSVAGACDGPGRRRGDGGDGGPVRDGGRLGPKADGVALCPDRGGGGGARAADRLGDARRDRDAGCGRGLSSGSAVPGAGGGMPGGGRGGGEAVLCGRLE